MRRLRDPVSGCEWDRKQTFATISPYTIEEAYEVADAIARDDMDALADELGDLQLQVVFHAQMAEEAGLFTLEDVISGICDKLERDIRTSSATPEHGLTGWEQSRQPSAKKSPTKRPGRRCTRTTSARARGKTCSAELLAVGFDWPEWSVHAPRSTRNLPSWTQKAITSVCSRS